MKRAEEEAFVRFVTDASPSLLSTAWMLTGDRHAAEELVQEALERVYVRWGRVRQDDAVAYTRRVVVNLHTDTWRRRRREVLVDATPERGATHDSQHVDIMRALAQLPTRERECVVLRHYADMSETQVADLLGVSVGTVKSSSSRGLGRLRELMGGALHVTA